MIEAAPQTESEDTGFASRVRSAVAWRWGSQLIAQIIAWTSTLIVVRLLEPGDYGLFAMTQVVLVALNFLNGHSFATSLIQADKVDERRIGQVFAMLIMLNAGLAVFQLVMAPVAADYYNQPQVDPILRVQALIFFTTPFIAMPTALLSRRLEFRSQGLANMTGAITGAVTALGMAWLDYGVWALVVAPIVGFASRGIVLTWAARLLVWPVFDMRGAGDLISFGGALTICQLFWIVQSQSDIFIAGRSFDLHDLGLYSEALFLTLIVTGRFLPPINEVAFPAYAELHKAGKPLGPFFITTLRTVLLVTAPIYIGLALTADEAVYTLFGPKWTEMAPIVAGLSLAMPLMALQIICSPATNAMGKPSVYLATNGFGALLYPALFLLGVSAGPMGLVHAWWAAAPSLLIVTLALTLPKVGVGWRQLAGALAPCLAATLAMALIVMWAKPVLPPLPPPVTLLLVGALGASVYIGVLLVIARPALQEIRTFILHRELDPAATA
ncbi:lipopolysaccharide biosynthesis protein [Altererythrobacter sp. MTPC7]|uniref:lipopolysaccharide biosynthesis protein n=1 Tax=Altererythrobacter sp. MTPC7 TaxID=3056567 RepID=UPI0036F28CE0